MRALALCLLRPATNLPLYMEIGNHMLISLRRKDIPGMRPYIFLGTLLGFLIVTLWIADIFPTNFSILLSYTTSWFWVEWILAALAFLFLAAAVSWFAPLIYFQYIEDVEKEQREKCLNQPPD